MKVVLGLSRGSGSVMGRNWNCVDQVVKSFPSSTLAGQSWGSMILSLFLATRDAH